MCRLISSVDLERLRERNRLILNVMYNKFQRLQKKVELIGYIKTSTEDIDLFVILLDDEDIIKNNFNQRFYEFEKTLNSIIQELRDKYNFYVCVYPHFRDRALYELDLKYNNNISKEIIFIHLHYFDNYTNFIKMTFPMIAKTIVKNLQPIVGNIAKLKRIVEGMPQPTLYDCLEFLKTILYDTRCFFMLQTINNDLSYICYTMIYRIFYIVKYLIFYILHFKYNIPTEKLLTWDMLKKELENNIKYNDQDLIYLFNLVYSWKFKKEEITLDNIRKLLDKILICIGNYIEGV